MTLPSSGEISVAAVNTELGSASTTQRDLLAIDNLIKPAQRGTNPNLAQLYNKAYYQRNMDGNCNNGNCNCGDCNCACDFNCNNCYAASSINCTNCDTQSWLQSDCNCACTYNCNQGQFPYNCNCDCACQCDCR